MDPPRSSVSVSDASVSEPPSAHSTSSFIVVNENSNPSPETPEAPPPKHTKATSFSLSPPPKAMDAPAAASTSTAPSGSLSVPNSPTRPRYNFTVGGGVSGTSTPANASRQNSSRNLSGYFGAEEHVHNTPIPRSVSEISRFSMVLASHQHSQTTTTENPFNPPIATVLTPPLNSPTSATGTNGGTLSPSPSFVRSSFSSPPLRHLSGLNPSSRLTHSASSSQSSNSRNKKNTKSTTPFKSSLLDKEAPISKPWLDKSQKDPFVLISYLLTYGFILVGAIAGGVRCFFAYRDVPVLPDANLCSIMDESFDSDRGIFATSGGNGGGGTFLREIDLSGFGNGQFEMTTGSSDNSFVRDGRLYLMPTLTADSLGEDKVLDNHVFNATDCTFNLTKGDSWTASSSSPSSSLSPLSEGEQDALEEYYLRACSAVSNATEGSVINPVQSARLSTKFSANIQFGRVEIKAKLPRGDWLWPALWMLPVNDTYGPWPLSGEIDIMESRGNSPEYPHQGTNVVRGSLNWGPLTWLNSVWRTYGWWAIRRGNYADDFHTYAVEWTESFIRIYVDSRLHHTLDITFNKPFWERGEFPSTYLNGSQVVALQNPWGGEDGSNGNNAAPFDKPFYLIISLGVGSTNGWFPDGPEKPWLDGSKTAMRDFIMAKDQWYPTWGEGDDRAFIIDSVKMWQKCS